jgi:RNA polymerase sigma-70 factor (ECF subfamily)
VRSLPKRQRQVVALHYLEDLPVTRIAEIIDVAEGTVKAHLHAARAALAAKLDLEEGSA